MKNILITGAASGIGRLTAEVLLNAGYRVAASMRSPRKRRRKIAEELTGLGAEVIEIDVTDEKSVQEGVGKAIRRLGGLDVVINNAGLGALGIQEGYTPEDWRKIFEVNVFGVQRMTKAVLPHFKEARHGLLILISSLTGRLAIPFQGPYGPSKWAAEALAESYRAELSQFGIESCIIEPGGLPATFIDQLLRPSDESRLNSYGETGKIPDKFLEEFKQAFAKNPAQNPQMVADAVLNLIEKPHGTRPLRAVVDEMGLGDYVREQNTHLEKITTDIYRSFGIGHLLRIKDYE